MKNDCQSAGNRDCGRGSNQAAAPSGAQRHGQRGTFSSDVESGPSTSTRCSPFHVLPNGARCRGNRCATQSLPDASPTGKSDLRSAGVAKPEVTSSHHDASSELTDHLLRLGLDLSGSVVDWSVSKSFNSSSAFCGSVAFIFSKLSRIRFHLAPHLTTGWRSTPAVAAQEAAGRDVDGFIPTTTARQAQPPRATTQMLFVSC